MRPCMFTSTIWKTGAYPVKIDDEGKEVLGVVLQLLLVPALLEELAHVDVHELPLLNQRHLHKMNEKYRMCSVRVCEFVGVFICVYGVMCNYVWTVVVCMQIWYWQVDARMCRCLLQPCIICLIAIWYTSKKHIPGERFHADESPAKRSSVRLAIGRK